MPFTDPACSNVILQLSTRHTVFSETGANTNLIEINGKQKPGELGCEYLCYSARVKYTKIKSENARVLVSCWRKGDNFPSTGKLSHDAMGQGPTPSLRPKKKLPGNCFQKILCEIFLLQYIPLTLAFHLSICLSDIRKCIHLQDLNF